MYERKREFIHTCKCECVCVCVWIESSRPISMYRHICWN